MSDGARGRNALAMTTSTFRAAAVVGAAAAAFLVWLVAGPLADVDLTVERGGAVGPGAVVGIALGAGLVGWALLAVLERVTARAAVVWRALAVAVLVVSLVGPLGATGTAATVTLMLMHLVVGTVLIVAMGRTTRSRTDTRTVVPRT